MYTKSIASKWYLRIQQNNVSLNPEHSATCKLLGTLHSNDLIH